MPAASVPVHTTKTFKSQSLTADAVEFVTGAREGDEEGDGFGEEDGDAAVAKSAVATSLPPLSDG